MIFDPKRRVYLAKGRIVPPEEVRREIESEITKEQKAVNAKAKKLLAGIITVTMFFDWLRERVATWHSHAGVIGYGGQSQMDLEKWKRINEIVQGQIAYLNEFEKAAEQSLQETRRLAAEIASSKDIPAGLGTVIARDVESAIMSSDAAGRDAAIKDAVENALADSIGSDEAGTFASRAIGDTLETATGTLIWGAIASRAGMYASAAQATYENQARAGMLEQLGEIVAGTDIQIIERRLLGESHMSCETCIEQADEGWQPEGTLNDIGDSECLANCNCQFEYRVAGSMRDSDFTPGDLPYGVENLPMSSAYVVNPSAMPRGGRARL